MSLDDLCMFKGVFLNDIQKVGHNTGKPLTFNVSDSRHKCRHCNGYEKQMCKCYVPKVERKDEDNYKIRKR